ncbi:glycosyltransferase family 2 protein [Xenorhabdus miraniensis]|uniref:Capsular polysaccharide biosynthesis protein CpsI n=1 Tax=Xenorhabdus miraniensis TaxID=351674 RepID=A0A2D0JLL5_9GAMM|nr:glycosyltransferase family 2 protein [Xenorhabdus miraniensis]PHM47194.1 capsular polysaccharide biosynthesis protein CpsI [Xenorhabdus miraniensis]
MKNSLVSIIIPAFNVERLITKTINSVLNQTYNNIQIVIINDGSNDNTLKIIEKLANKYKNIVFFSQENKGISSARNLGLRKATGDYISFLDSDDVIEPNFVECMLSKSREDDCNIVFCLNKTIDKFNNVILSKNYTDINEVALNYINFDYFDICCLFIKRNFILDNNIYFNENLIVGEDVLFILMCICKTNLSCVPKHLYNYIYRDSSIMNKKWFVKDYINEIQAWEVIYHSMDMDYHKNNRKILMQKIGSKTLSLKISYMWKLLASNKNGELLDFISKLHYSNEDILLLKRKSLLKLNILKSKNKLLLFLSRVFFTKRKDFIE